MDEELDLVVFNDDDGNEKTMEVLDYFFYEGQEYAILTEYDEEKAACDAESCEGCEECEAYIMKVVPVGEDQEEFVPVDDALADTLIELVQSGAFDEDDDVEDEEDDDPENP